MDDKSKVRLRELIREKSLIIKEEGKFKLASGGESNFLFDIKIAALDPKGANLISEAIMDILKDEDVDYIGGLESGAIPIVSAVCEKSWLMGKPIPGFFVRKAAKERGSMKLIEGNFENNSMVVILDDVTTKGGSVLNAVNEVRRLGCKVDKVITVVDRLDGAKEKLKDNNIVLIPIFTRDDFDIK